jgi:transposase
MKYYKFSARLLNACAKRLVQSFLFRIRNKRDKAKIENGVQCVERWVIAPLRNRQFFGLQEVNVAVKEKLELLNTKVMKGVGRSRRQEFEEIDLPNLRPLPEKPYEYAERKIATVNIDYHVVFDHHLYSVPNGLIHQKVDIHATEKMVDIFHNGKSIAIHPRNFRIGRFSTLRAHMPANHRFMDAINSDSLIEWAGNIGPKTATLVKATLQSRPFSQQAYRTCLGILSLAKKYSTSMMEQACQTVFESKVFFYKAVVQELVYLQKKATPPPIGTLPTHENIRGAEYFQDRNPS